jgi:hypothetical protein
MRFRLPKLRPPVARVPKKEIIYIFFCPCGSKVVKLSAIGLIDVDSCREIESYANVTQTA